MPNALAADNFLKSEQKPDAIISEYYISGSNGIEFHDALRKNPAFNKVAFILISHEFKEELFKTAFTKGIDDFYVLPLPSVEDIIGRIRFLRDYRFKHPVKETVIEEDVKFGAHLSKRIFDIVVAGAALICLSPLLLIVIIAIRLESKGKIYYTSKRFGRCEIFDFYKLRSMRTGADAELKKLAKEKNQYDTAQKSAGVDFSRPCPGCSKLPAGERCSPIIYFGEDTICEDWYNHQKKTLSSAKSAFVKISNDPRVTRVGKFIRNTSIDELPQLINVLKGDMSIVGNRPLPLYEAEQLTQDKDDMALRFQAPAGITGLWQVELRGKRGVMSEKERKKLDNDYANHFIGDKFHLRYDLGLILRTIPALFQKDSV
ncbi:MAG: sugar transferase [Bacteroidetes bacterium]|nr:sugar transferase [Bacteroidota bacterium]